MHLIIDKPTDNSASENADIITDWMSATGSGELGLLDLLLFDQLVYQKSQRKPNHR